MNKNNFDFLRFVFAFVVVLSHLIDLSHLHSFLPFKRYFDSHLSVTAFFIISGFLIAGSYIKTNNVKLYFVKRAKRLLPAYIFIIVFSFFFFSFFSKLTSLQYFSSPILYKYLFANLLFTNFIQPCLPGVFDSNLLCTINGALWTIKVEVSFYLILPIILYFGNKIKEKIYLYIGLYLFSLLYFYGLGFASLKITKFASIFDILQHQIPGFLTYFVSGIAIYEYFDKFSLHKNKLLFIAIVVFIIEYYYNLEVFRPIAMSILIFYFAFSFKWFNNWGKYGDFSYGIYIYHFPIIQLVIALNLFNLYNPFLVAFLTIIFISICAIISWHCLEKKFLFRGANKALKS